MNIISSKVNSQEKTLKYYIIPFFCILSFLFFWVSDTSFYSYLGLALLIIPAVFYKLENTLFAYFFLLPSISMLKLSKDGFAFLSLFISIIFIRYILFKKAKFSMKILILQLLYFISGFLSYYLAGNELSILTQEIRVIISLFLLFFISKDMLTDKKVYSSISNSFIYGCLISALVGLLHIRLTADTLDEVRLKSVNSDPNYFSLCLALCVALILMKIYLEKFGLIDIILIFAFIIFGFMSLSRGFLVAMIFNTLLIIYLFVFTAKINWLLKLASILLAVLIVFSLREYLGELITKLSERIFNEPLEGGSGRFYVWSIYLSHTVSSVRTILLGIGASYLYSSLHGRIVAQHNIYIELFTGKGIIGSIIVLSIYFNLFKTLRKNMNVSKIYIVTLVPLATVLLGFLFLSGIVSDIGIMTIFLGIYSIMANSREIADKKLLTERKI